MVAIGSCVGSGIFLTPAQIAPQLPLPGMILLIWGLGGLIALAGALTITFATYLAFIFPIPDQGILVVAVLAIALVTAVNILRVKAAEVFSNVFTGLKLAGIAGLILVVGGARFSPTWPTSFCCRFRRSWRPRAWPPPPLAR
jgi:APA family basic amino acid/polyamine antiporter